VGGAIILFDVVIPPRVGLAMEFSVALMLILLGVLSLTGLLRRVTAALTPGEPAAAPVHAHPHTHDDYVHDHPHGHGPDSHGHEGTPLSWMDRLLGRLGVYQLVRPIVVGLVHGLAGSAAVALLVLATIRDPRGPSATCALRRRDHRGMMVITALIGLPFAYTATRLVRTHRYLGFATGILSIALGLFLAYEIGVGDGLFTANPQWTPK
jgi:high-affinity nickel-transport protein